MRHNRLPDPGLAWSSDQVTGSLTTFDDDVSPGACARAKRSSGLSVSVVLPALNEESTVGPICRAIVDELVAGVHLVDDLVVMDGGSTDGTASRARLAGARVVDVGDVLPDVELRGGKGESLWRSLAVVETDLVVWIDADIRNFGPGFVTNLVFPLLTRPDLDFVKAYYRRPLQLAETLLPHDGGRVTELLAKPLLATLFPELTSFHQPLSGEYAARTAVVRDLPFFTGYSVEVGLLVDMIFQLGLGRMAQADLGTRVHRNRPLPELAPMARSLSSTILRRAADYGRVVLSEETRRLVHGVAAGDRAEVERPPMCLAQGDWRYDVRDAGAALSS